MMTAWSEEGVVVTLEQMPKEISAFANEVREWRRLMEKSA
jgi:hypothetical protein